MCYTNSGGGSGAQGTLILYLKKELSCWCVPLWYHTDMSGVAQKYHNYLDKGGITLKYFTLGLPQQFK